MSEDSITKLRAYALGFAIASVWLFGGIDGVLTTTVRECVDGWPSHSIGRQGACSHHGGVTTRVIDRRGPVLGPISDVAKWTAPLSFVLFLVLGSGILDSPKRPATIAKPPPRLVIDIAYEARTRRWLVRTNRKSPYRFQTRDAAQGAARLVSECANKEGVEVEVVLGREDGSIEIRYLFRVAQASEPV